MKGTDISSFQAGINFASSDVDIVYIKATEGMTYVNPCLKAQYNNAKANGKKVGFYHYLRNNGPINEAKSFLNTIQGLEADCKYCIDAETNFNGASSSVRQFADYLKSQGKEPVLYTGAWFYENTLDSTVKDLPLWVAAYGQARPNLASIGWQYSDKGNINGVNVDLDVFEEGILLTPVVKVAPADISVKSVQHNLNRLFNFNLTEDGLNGPLTTAAMASVSKILGVTSLANILAATNQILSFPFDSVPSPHLEYATRYIQYRVGATIDGDFGTLTKVKVQNFQATHGLVADGEAGPKTWTKLME